MMLRKLLLSLAVLPALLISMQTLANQNNKEVPGLKMSPY